MIIEREKVVQIVSEWMSKNKGYTAPPKMEMDNEGNVKIIKQ